MSATAQEGLDEETRCRNDWSCCHSTFSDDEYSIASIADEVPDEEYDVVSLESSTSSFLSPTNNHHSKRGRLPTDSFHDDCIVIDSIYDPPARAHDELLRTHAETVRSRDQLPHYVASMEKVLADIGHLLQATTIGSPQTAKLTDFQSLMDQFLSSKEQLLDHNRSLSASEEKLSSLEYSVATKQARFVTSWRDFIQRLLDRTHPRQSPDHSYGPESRHCETDVGSGKDRARDGLGDGHALKSLSESESPTQSFPENDGTSSVDADSAWASTVWKFWDEEQSR